MARIPPQERDIHTPQSSFFPDLLRRAQNPDGGWGYRQGLQSTTEPTAWSILALLAHEGPPDKVISSACDWLRRTQTDEGAWPTSSGKDPGCWVTALACLAMAIAAEGPEGAVSRGTKWLCSTWPAEGNLLWRLRQLRQEKSEIFVHQDHSLRGWGWTPNTASWVEPTAYVMIMLQNLPPQLRPPEASRRLQLAERMLYDRACRGGGWNAGNPLVYGVPGVPRIGPTAWALLALRQHPEHSAVLEGLGWLEEHYQNPRSPASLALTQLCLKVFSRPTRPIEDALCDFYGGSEFLRSTPVVAWASLALGELPRWLGPSSPEKGVI
ncbi:MAG TPA: prenyltransferase/squalene oxidase repeat-containing protein [Terriglobia bacterium]|nr:prenyltransferase/squalene oxidase repeat-containing protein [Terriglobia bacterium]